MKKIIGLISTLVLSLLISGCRTIYTNQKIEQSTSITVSNGLNICVGSYVSNSGDIYNLKRVVCKHAPYNCPYYYSDVTIGGMMGTGNKEGIHFDYQYC